MASIEHMRHANSHGNPPDRASGLRIINAEALRHKILPPETWVIDGILPAGCTVFAGRSKDGKSQLGYGIAVAVATGGAAFGAMPVAQGDVLYLALEDGERRAQKRVQAQCDRAPNTVDLSRLELVFWEAPPLGNGLERELDAWIASKAAPRLIIIDILEKVRPRAAKHGNVYAEAYAATASLTQLAQERNIAILVVHHVSKIRSEDIRDAISGPVSLLGGADTFWVLKRIAGETDATLAIGGRDVAEQELALQFKDGFWTLLGGAEQYRLSKTRQEIIQCLTECAGPQTPRQLDSMLPQIGYEAIKKTLQRMSDDGQIINLGGGRYGLRPSCDPPARDGKETDTPPVPAVPGVPTVPEKLRDSAYTRPVPQHDATHPLKTKVFEDFGDKGTVGTPGTPDEPETAVEPLCLVCRGRDLVSDAKGHYCVTCRCRFSHR